MATVTLVPGPAPTLKRKHTDSDAVDESASAIQNIKRQRVAFDNDVKVHLVHDWNEKGLALVREEVKRGIEKHISGDSNSYNQLKTLFTQKPGSEDAPSSSLLKKYIVALTRSVTLLNRDSSGLVHAILDCSWLGRDEDFVGVYGRLLGSLISTNGGYTAAVMRMLVSNFARLPPSAGRLAGSAIVRREQLITRNHDILQYLLRLVPSASSALSSAIKSGFPFPTESTKIHVAYVLNLLRLTEYSRELKGEIISLIIERLVKIDVQFQVDMEDVDEDIQESLLSHQDKLATRQLEPEESGAEDSESDSDETITPEERRLRELKDLVTKIDELMNILFQYYQPIFAHGSISDYEDAFEHLLLQFESTIIPTYRSRHTQFLLFHFSQVYPSLTERFVGACASIAFDKSRPQITRFAAAAYLGSFIARGKHVTKDVVRSVFALLLSHMDSLRRTHEPGCTGPDPKRYGGYYSIAQAILYTFCFRWRDLIELAPGEEGLTDDELLWEGRQLRWMRGIKDNLYRNIHSVLNPLKVCSPVVVQQFSHLSRHLNFLYVHHLVESNKRVVMAWSVPSAPTSGKGSYAAGHLTGIAERDTALSVNVRKGQAKVQLDAFFPFDPYQLPKSKGWVEEGYNAWKGIPGVDDEEEEEGAETALESESEGEDEEDEVEVVSESDLSGDEDEEDRDGLDEGTNTDRSI